MKNNKLEELIIDYLNGDMDSSRESEFRNILKQEGFNPDQLSELENIFARLDKYQVPEPSSKMDDGFYAMLDNYKQEIAVKENRTKRLFSFFGPFFPQKYLPQIAYSLILLIIGCGAGFLLKPDLQYESQIGQMSAEIHEMRELMILTLIDQPSAASRIKAVNMTTNFDNVNDKVVTALLKTLNNDPNENVRLITVEALYEFADNPRVREGLILSIIKQDSPLVQLALADIMIALQEKKSVEYFENLLKKKDLNDSVRNRLEQTVRVLM